MTGLILTATKLSWFAQAWPVLGPIVAIVITASLTGAWAMWNRRGAERNKAKIPLPPTWPEMWARIDKLEKNNEALEQRVEMLEQENRELKETNQTILREKQEILEHVVDLERQIPEPPPRPTWSVPVAVAGTK